MCGIAGIVSKTKSISVKDIVFGMSRSIKHRGPDGEGFAFFYDQEVTAAYSHETPEVNRNSSNFKFNPFVPYSEVDQKFTIALAHRRLSIIDLSESGHQPMCDVSGDYWVTFNGEIYNYIELREELKQKGYSFITQTDTEVLVAAYKEWGINCLEKLNGMWAFALLDRKNNRLFCARDRVGVKPFYFINNDVAFAFASEYKAFIQTKLQKFDINEGPQYDYIVNASLENEDQSLFKGINELKPSHYLIYDLKSHFYEIRPYYSISTTNFIEKSDQELIDKTEELVVNSIKLRLRSDVEIGSCLSGGLDSSIIAGVIKHLQPDHPLKLFTAVFPKETFDESSYAKSVSNFIKGDWKTITPGSEEFFKDLETLNYYQDLPVWSTSTYSQHRVMQLARDNGIKVVLDGQGADELFGGYAHHYIALWKESFGLKTIKQIKESQLTIYKPYQLFFKQRVKDVFNLSYDYSKYLVDSKRMFGKSKHDVIAGDLNEQLRIDYFGRLKSFLKCEDRCSMAFGIESRVPFADDVELVDFIFSVKGNKKIQQGISKYLLREATKSYVPESIYKRRDKIGFETPVANWLLPNKERVLDEIRNQLEFIDHRYLASNFDDLLCQKPTFVLRLYSFSVWKKVYSGL